MAVKRYEVRVSVSNVLTYSVFMEEDWIDDEAAMIAIRETGDQRILGAGDVHVLSIQELRP
jgi:hypothetical protein